MKIQWFDLANRKILVDYHTPEFIKNATKDFDAKEWIKLFKQSGANAGVFFSKCHHGNSYYNTKIGHKHDKLDGDMLADLVREARKEDMKIFVYYSVCWDKRAASSSPDYVQRKSNGEAISYRIWDYLCLNSPYTDEIVIPQLEEIATNYDIDGLFLDIVYQHSEGCYCDYCRKKYQQIYKKDIPNNPHLLHEFRMRTTTDFLKEVNTRIKKIKPLMIGLNGILYFPPFVQEPDFQILRLISKKIDYFTVEARCESMVKEESFSSLDPLAKTKLGELLDKPFEIVTSAYVHSWGAWDIVPKEVLERIYAQALTGGAVSFIGLQGYPQGILDKASLSTISAGFNFIKERQKWCIGTTSVPNIALMGMKFNRAFKGAFQILVQNQMHFDLIDKKELTKIDKYQVVVCPNLTDLDDYSVGKIRDYVKRGGSILASYLTGQGKNNSVGLTDVFGVDIIEPVPYSLGYLKITEKIDKDCPKTVLLINDKFLKISLEDSVEILAKLVYPITETTPDRYLRHDFSPPGSESPYPAITLNKFGEGLAAYCTAPIFRAFWTNNHWYVGQIIKNIINLIQRDRFVEIDAPKNVELVVNRQDNSIIIHLLSYSMGRRTENISLVDEFPIVRDVLVKVSQKLIKPRRIYTVPNQKDLQWKLTEQGMVEFKVAKVGASELVVMERQRIVKI